MQVLKLMSTTVIFFLLSESVLRIPLDSNVTCKHSLQQTRDQNIEKIASLKFPGAEPYSKGNILNETRRERQRQTDRQKQSEYSDLRACQADVTSYIKTYESDLK